MMALLNRVTSLISQSEIVFPSMEAHTRFTDRIAQLISIRIGSNLPPITTVSKDLQNVSQLLDRFPVGHLVLFNGGPSHEAAAALEALQRQVDVPLLIGMDMENGSGQQISDHTLWPHALAFDALGGDAAEAVERFAEYSAQQAASIGIHISFSPVLDIHRNSNNPIIATRAFGTTPSRVIELGRAYVRGCHAGGLLCCGKHFPGHGNTVADSHQELPVVLDSIDVLRGTDLATFRQFVREEIDMLMTAHVAYPQLDASRAPATLSEPILTNILRGEWKYQGLVISDSFKMEGIPRSRKSVCESHDNQRRGHSRDSSHQGRRRPAVGRLRCRISCASYRRCGAAR